MRRRAAPGPNLALGVEAANEPEDCARRLVAAENGAVLHPLGRPAANITRRADVEARNLALALAEARRPRRRRHGASVIPLVRQETLSSGHIRHNRERNTSRPQSG